jgi:hypothetical protein
MSNPENDSRLEQLSREAADRYTVKASPSWDKMERELDKVLPVEKKKRRPFLFWWIIPGVLLGGSILWYHLNTRGAEKENIASTIVQNNVKKEATIKNSLQQVPKQEATHAITFIRSEKKEKKSSTDRKYTQISSSTDVRKNKSNSTVVEQEEASAAVKSNSQSLMISTEEKKANTKTATTSSAENTQFIRPTIDTGSTQMNNSILTVKDSTPLTIMDTQEPATLTTKDSIISKNNKNKGSFSFALLAGLDATTVKFRYADKASLSGGIMIGYHFNNNWSIHTGGLYTRKKYKMAGSDFKAPAGSWVANYKLETVDGFCDMWEVPLTVRYTFDTKTKTKAFVSSGLSSYLMTRENYNYFYYYNGLPVRRNANYPNGKTHLFSILKLSAGWLRETGKNSSFIVEPFANIPLNGLGFGSVKLSSFGVNFSYQFRQPNRKK